jgi:hypothetical protein
VAVIVDHEARAPVLRRSGDRIERSIPVRGKGILERSGLALVQYCSPYLGLNDLRSSVHVDAIILDASRSTTTCR